MQSQAQAGDLAMTASPEIVLALAVVALVLAGAMIIAIWHVRQKARLSAELERLRGDYADAQSVADIRAGIIAASDQRVVAFAGRDKPEVLGSLPASYESPREPAPFLSFRDWMPAYDAMALEKEIDKLRMSAEPFRREVELANGKPLDIAGKTVGALAIVRFTPLSGMREELASLRIERQRTTATIETMQSLFDAAPMPVWLRARSGVLVWVNDAFARSVEAESVDDAIDRQVEFFNAQDRAAIAAAVTSKEVFKGGLTAVVEGDRRNFEVVDAAGPLGSAGLAVDISGIEAVRRELKETLRSHSETLDHLTTAVARFDEKTLLIYYNAEFQKLFDLSETYLDGKPDHIAIMDQLRTRGIMPEDRPLRDLKDEIMAAYRAARPTDALWHLADGRTLRVFASPEPQGGATWVFEDLTEKFQLESRLNALVRLQGETLDYLKEAVAVFGQDGRLRLSNPTFAEMWGLSQEFLSAKPHIRAFASATPAAIRQSGPDGASWGSFANAVTAFDEGARLTESGEFELDDGRMQSFGIVPLPNGQTMLTFADVSVARQAERMLRERNEALEQADRLKNDFVQHVSYELRSPLTNIIGFSALLRTVDTGPLNDRQSEYLDYITTSTRALMTIVNDILDLASIDAGTIQLDLTDVDIGRTVEQAVEAVEDKLQQNAITLETDLAGATLRADGKRVVQILFNLLSNAINFSPPGGKVRLSVSAVGGHTVFLVADEGPGIAPDAVARAFERFEQNSAGGRKSGAGLGLSIVKSFVELHGGDVEIMSGAQGGTVVTCRFPSIPGTRTEV